MILRRGLSWTAVDGRLPAKRRGISTLEAAYRVTFCGKLVESIELLVDVAASRGIAAVIDVTGRSRDEIIVISEERAQAYWIVSRNRGVVLGALSLRSRRGSLPLVHSYFRCNQQSAGER